jgi:hypothetical protein
MKWQSFAGCGYDSYSIKDIQFGSKKVKFFWTTLEQ